MSESSQHEDHPDVVSRNARYGLVLFAVYVALYGGFIYMAAFRQAAMSEPIWGGVNLAIVYGFALIAAAFVLAMIYMFLCRGATSEESNNDAS